MKKVSLSTLICILAAAFLSLPATAQQFNAVTPSGHTVHYSHEFSDAAGTVRIEAASDVTYEGNLVIPSSVENDGTTYTVIGTTSWDGFKNQTGLTSVTLAEGVADIGSYAFQGCTGLTSVSMGGVTLAISAFDGCTNLVSVTATSCSSIGQYAFHNCTSLTSVDLPNCTTVGERAFYGCTSLTSVDLPNCTTVGEGASYGCTSLTSVDLPNCTTVGEEAFYGCTSLTSVDLPNCTTIGNDAFASCSSLAEVDLPICTSIGNNAFASCSSLTAVDLPVCTTIGDNAFSNCTALTEASLPSCTSLGTSAFSNCSSLTSVDLSSCTTIANNAFYRCTSLTSANLSTCTSVGEYAFYQCKLALVDLPNCTTINDYTFYGCSSLTSANLSSCTTIGSSAFSYCSSLTSADLSNCITIGSSAFSYCSSLTSVSLSNCTTISDYAFRGCPLSISTLPATVTSIGTYAFYGCNQTILTVPDGVESIGNNAFSGVIILYYNGSATGAPWGAQYLNGVIADGLYYTVNDDSTWTLHVGSSVSSFPDNSSGVKVYDIDQLSAIEVDAANSTFSSVDGVLYSKNKKELLRVPAARSGNLSIGVGVTSIAQKAFNGCSLIDTLFFNASACVPSGQVPKFQMLKNNIGTYDNPIYTYYPSYTSGIFNDLTHFNVLEVGEDVDTLYYTITSLPGVKHINVSTDNWKYYSNNGLLVNEAGNTVLRCPVGREGAFSFPDGLTRVEKKAFAFCRQITSLDLSDVSYIGSTTRFDKADGAFAHCTGIHTLTIPATLDTLGLFAFYGNFLDTLYYNAPNAICRDDSTLIKMYGIGYSSSVFQSDSLQVVIVGDGVKVLPDALLCHNKSLYEVQLPDGLTAIGTATLGDCPMLARIDIPSSVRDIRTAAFSGCTLLDSIVLPDSLQIIGHSAFHNCASLGEITIPPAVHTIGTSAFGKCSELKRIYYNARSCAWSIDTNSAGTSVCYKPSSSFSLFTTVEYNKYSVDVNVEHLIVGEGVRSMLPIWAVAVDTLTLPSTLDTVILSKRSNYKDGNLRHVNFNCHQLRLVYDYYTPDSISNISLFGKSGNLRHVVFGDSVLTIPTYCFYGCDQVREFDTLPLPATLISLGSGAFEGCTQIKSAVIPQGLTEVGASPFLGCKKLKKITYNATESVYYGDLSLPNLDRSYTPNSALTYNNVAKFNARKSKVALADLLPPVDTVTIGPGVRNIPPCFFGFPWNQLLDTNAFDRTVYINNQSTSLQTIGNGAFANMVLENAESLFSDSLQYIDQAAFMNTSGLRNVRLPEGCWYVGAGAFRNCQDLDSLWLPSTLQWLGTDAFLLDSSLSYLYYDCDSLGIDHVEPSSCTPFGNTVSLHSIDFGPNVRYLTEGIFYNAEGLERLELPEGLLEIGNYCFYMQISDSKHDAATAGSTSPSPSVAEPEPLTIFIIVSGYISGSVDTASLHYVSLPTTLQSIGKYAFRQGGAANHYNLNPVSHLDTIVCRGTEPAAIGVWELAPQLADEVWYISPDKVFEDSTFSHATLIVPCGAKSNYENYSQLKPKPDPSGGFYTLKGKNYYYEYTWEDAHPTWADFQHIEEQTPYKVVLTVNVDTMGTAEWECSTGGVQLTATPAPSHRFLQWSDGITDNPRTISLVSDTALEAQFAWGVIYTVSVSSSNSSHGSVTGSGSFIQESIDTLTATANYGYHFSQWSDGNSDNPRYLTVLDNTTLTATFLPNQYTLEVECDDEQGTVSGDGSYDYNTSHSISATPAEGYHFTQWSDGNTDNPRSVTLTQDTTFTALFDINVYTLTVTAGEHGSVSDGGDYEHGTEVTLTATPDEGYHFSQWSDGSTDNPHTITLTADLSISATFAPNRYAIDVIAGDGGSAVASSDSADYGTTITLTATADEGHHFSLWQDGNTDNPRTATIVCDTQFVATFERNSYSVSVSCESEQGEVTGSNTYLYGDTATLTATAAEHWHFVQWSDGDKHNPRLVVVTANLSLEATFALDQYTVTVTSADPSMGTANGGGKVNYGEEALLTATAKSGYHFDHWQDGNSDNPRTITVSSDTVFTAYFEANEPEGIADVYNEAGISVRVQDGHIVVQGAEGMEVYLYDAVGRRIADRHQHLSAGIYLLQVDGLPARRVVVM